MDELMKASDESQINQKINLKLYRSSSRDAVTNTATEAFLTSQVSENDVILFFWQNDHSIIIGKNQNLWSVCKVDEFLSNNGTIVRRLTGGGAVYQDMGVLNFSVISKQNKFDINTIMKLLKESLDILGVDFLWCGKKGLSVEKRVLLNHSHYKLNDGVCCHGYVFVDSSLMESNKYLNHKRRGRKQSIHEPLSNQITNLTDYNSDVTTQDVVCSIVKVFKEHYGVLAIPSILEKNCEVSSYKYWHGVFQKWSWTYASNPEFDVELTRSFSWGTVELGIKVDQGQILDFRVYTDAIETEYFERLMKQINGIEFSYSRMKTILDETKSHNHEIMMDMIVVIKELIVQV